MDREAPKLGAGVGRQARKRAGLGSGTAPLQVARRGCSRSVGLQVSAGVGPMPGGWSARDGVAEDGRRVFFRSQIFR